MSATTTGEGDGFFVTIGKTIITGVTSLLAGIVDYFLRFFDIDPNIVGGLFIMTHLIVMVIGWGTLFTAAFMYKGTGSNPIFGDGLAKAGTFLLALICYAIPFVNIFPWFFIWTLTVAKSPK